MATFTIHFKGSTNDAWGYPESISFTPGSYVTIPTHTPARTGHSFHHWNDELDGTGWNNYYPGETSIFVVQRDVYLYAQWTENIYTITYDLNGGSGVVSDQDKFHDIPLTLLSNVPTRNNYTFKGWGVSPTSSTASYQPGSTYSVNADITLYAIWELSYDNPSITNLKVYRSDSSGNASDSGTYFKVSFGWSTHKSVSSILVEWVTSGGTTWSNSYISASGTSGNASGVFGSGKVSVDRNYNVRITVSDSNGSTTVTGRVVGQSYTVDFMPGGKGVAFGKYADQEDMFEVDWNAKFNGNLTVTGTASIKTYDDIIAAVKTELSEVFLKVYPVNSIYLSYSHVSPATLFGGTWVRISPYMLYATGETGVIGETFILQHPENDDGTVSRSYGIKISAWRRTA